MMKMTPQEFQTLEKAMHDLVDGVNQKFETKQKETLEKVEEMFNQRDQQCTSSYDDGFHKVSHYLSMLIELSSKTEHKVHTEIDEAVKKLKEMAYAG